MIKYLNWLKEEKKIDYDVPDFYDDDGSFKESVTLLDELKRRLDALEKIYTIYEQRTKEMDDDSENPTHDQLVASDRARVTSFVASAAAVALAMANDSLGAESAPALQAIHVYTAATDAASILEGVKAETSALKTRLNTSKLEQKPPAMRLCEWVALITSEIGIV